MLVLMACTIAVSAPIMMVGGVIMALREDFGLGLDPRRGGAGAVPQRRPRGQPDGAQLPQDAGAHRRGQPGPARADHRDPGRPRVRPRAPRGRAVRAGQRRPDRRGRARRAVDGHDVPARDARRERLQRRGDLVRRSPRRQRADGGRGADRVPLLPDADPDVGDDGDLHADDGAAGLGVRRPDRRGARHAHLGADAGAPRAPRPGPSRLARPRGRDLLLPGADAPVLCGGLLLRTPRADGRCDRVDRRRQVDAGQPGAAALRRDVRCGERRRFRRTPGRAGCALVADRAGPAEGLPVLRDGAQQPAPRQARRHRGRALAGPRDRPGS